MNMISFIGIGLYIFVVFPLSSQANFLGIGDDADPKPVNDIIDEIHNETDLPGGDIANDLIPSIIRFILGIFSVLLTGVALWSGILFVGQFGDEERITQAKGFLIWSLVGVAVTAVSYAFVSGLVNLNWNR